MPAEPVQLHPYCELCGVELLVPATPLTIGDVTWSVCLDDAAFFVRLADRMVQHRPPIAG